MLILSIIVTLFLIAACWVPRDPNKAMFWGAVAGAVIGGGLSLIGGAKDRKAQAKANSANLPVNQVKQWEKAGINPAFGISQGQWIPQQAASVGDSYARAGSLFADAGQSIDRELLERTAIKKENTKLRETLDKVTKKSEKSEFQKRAASLPLPSSGGGDPSTPAGSGDSLQTQAEKRAALTGNSGRPVEVMPVNDTGGTLQVTNPWLGGSVSVPTLDGDEPLSVGEFVANAPVIVPQIFWNWGKKGFDALPDFEGERMALPSGVPFHQNKRDFDLILKNRF